MEETKSYWQIWQEENKNFPVLPETENQEEFESCHNSFTTPDQIKYSEPILIQPLDFN